MSEELTTVEALTIVPDFMRVAFTQLPWDSIPAKVKLYARTPVLDPEDLRSVRSLADLDALPGWLPISGNTTARSDRGEMGVIKYHIDVASDHKTYTLSLRTPGGDPALVENDRGWWINSGVQGIEQETVAAAVWYIDGALGNDYQDLIVLITDQGLSGDMLIRGGAMYGMTSYDPSIQPSVVSAVYEASPIIPLAYIQYHNQQATGTTSIPHGCVVGDVATLTVWGILPTVIKSNLLITNIIDETTFQGFAVGAPDFEVTFSDIPGASAELTKTNADFNAGTVLLDTPAKAYEPTNAAHVWLRPQRMNLLANPRFAGPVYGLTGEDIFSATGAYGWKAGQTGDRENLPHLSIPPQYTADGTGASVVTSLYPAGRIVLESNLFPVTDNNFIGIKAGVLGRGTLRMGLVAWNYYYNRSTYVRLPDIEVDTATYTANGAVIPHDLDNPESYMFGGSLPTLPGTAEYSLRLEWEQDDYTAEELDAGAPDGTYFFGIILPVVDPTDGPAEFFDGSSTDGLAADYHWHGGQAHQHFSMWYNNRQNIEARLFGGVDTDTDTYKKGLLKEWTPSSSAVIPHWDSIEGAPIEGWAGDYFYPIKGVIHREPVTVPDQEFNHRLKPFYPDALVTEDGALVRDEAGEPVIIVRGEIVDDLLVDETGAPIMDEDENYILVA